MLKQFYCHTFAYNYKWKKAFSQLSAEKFNVFSGQFTIVPVLLRYHWFSLCIYFLSCPIGQLSAFTYSLPIRGNGFNRSRCFNWWWFNVFSSLACLHTLNFLWACLNMRSAFPWPSSNPAFSPAPAPVIFPKLISTRPKIWTRVGPPLQIL